MEIFLLIYRLSTDRKHSLCSKVKGGKYVSVFASLTVSVPSPAAVLCRSVSTHFYHDKKW